MKKHRILRKRRDIGSVVDELGSLCEAKEVAEIRIKELENEIKKRAEQDGQHVFSGQLFTAVVDILEAAQIDSKILYEFMADLDILNMFHACIGVKVHRVKMLLSEKEFKAVACVIIDEYGKVTVTKKDLT